MSDVLEKVSRKSVDIGQEISQPASLQFDPTRYLAELEEFDITEAQKHELLQTLWSILCSFVDLGFSVDVCTALLGNDDTIPADDDLS